MTRGHRAAGETGIVVATQVVEAGIDLNAAVLITEAAPWPSLVQRAGRCNRTGRVRDAELWWVAAAQAAALRAGGHRRGRRRAQPARRGALSPARTCSAATSRSPRTQVAVLRRSDFIGLFDTAPDLSGADIDIAPYVRDADDLDAQLAWATWTPEARGRAPACRRQGPAGASAAAGSRSAR